MIISQSMDIEIQVCGMINLPNGDSTLAAGDIPEQEPEFWDILVKTYPEGLSDDPFTLIEIDNIETQELLEKVLNDLAVFFPDASIENL